MFQYSPFKFDQLLLLGAVLSLTACADHAGKKTSAIKGNPYKDDYSAITTLSHRNQWGAANVHDPSVIKTDSCYYAYSTDAYYIASGTNFNDDSTKVGHIQIRQSKDLINWQFVGWAFDQMPQKAVDYVHGLSDGKGADGIWAPYIVQWKNGFRLYYSVSCFGTNSSVIGMAESASPEGPWTDKGFVVKTNPQSVMNAIDPSVVTDAVTGRMWMHYGSYFGGLHCLELNPETGLALQDGDQGHLVATRANKANQIIEAPEIVYQPELKKYFLFVSYDPLFTHYNVRVGRSDKPDGPFLDFFGNDMADTTNNYPILTHSYKFENHAGWSGNAHCGVINDNGKFFMFHQGRLAPDNLMMVMQTREIKWLPSGWPVVSPERYVGIENASVTESDLIGSWEVIEMNEIPDHVKLWQGQIPPGGWTYADKEFNLSQRIEFGEDGKYSGNSSGRWQLKNDMLKLGNADCVVFRGWDWENERETILFSGILENGVSVWGKKVNLTNKN